MLPTLVRRSFVPRQTFSVSDSIPRSYYLGHHHAALRDIQKRLSDVGLVLECRDYRVPITSWNPVLDLAVAGRERIIVYTHHDLGSDTSSSIERALRQFHKSHVPSAGGTTKLVFWRKDQPSATKQLLSEIRSVARHVDIIAGMRALVVGMPNVGKSTLLNKLRAHGMRKSNTVARVGAQPGVTRKLSSPVRILESEADGGVGLGEGVFVLDTPGVFVPYVSAAEDMVKLALVGSVKDDRIPMEILADYLLFRMNLFDPRIYAKYSAPTNEVNEFLGAVARATGKLKGGGEENAEGAAEWIVKQWRVGNLGKFILDDVSEQAFQGKEKEKEGEGALSMNQARKREKEARKERALNKSKVI
ncbi:Mitochondrial GTPase 1 [Colletotrichum trifolii]|uniref:Mitochondrial GTPase 1 n=1 Tax=Colletotrichum trifolii TaxID=5466 RepID=A0A4R8RKT2_COLTR|nr:Mitochondrial GTPase 1 [Colletotrichum trifolii]